MALGESDIAGGFKCFLMKKNYIVYTDGVGENRLTSVGSLAVCSVTIYAINYQLKTCRHRKKLDKSLYLLT